VKFWWPSKESAARCGVAGIAGLLLAASFPKPGIAGFAWVAPGLLLAAAAGTSPGTRFRVGYVGGLAHFLASLYWLLHIPVPVAPIVGWIALSAFLALYCGAWVWLSWKVFPGRFATSANPRPASDATVLPSSHRSPAITALLAEYVATPWLQRLGWALACAALWVSWEMVQARFLSGFPWNFLGASQYKMLPLIQISSLTGVYGVSFLVVWSSVALLSAAAVLLHRADSQWLWRREFFLVIIVIGVWAATGFATIRQNADAGRTNSASPPVKIALIQPSIPQTVIWDHDEEAEATRFRQLLELSVRALANKPDIVAWPEAAVPTLFRWSTNQLYNGQTVYEAVTSLARKHRVWVIIGADDLELNAQIPNQPDFYNSSFLISPDGETLATYRKQRLVIFGEYVPLSRVFPFLKDFTQVYGEFKPGKSPVAFAMPSLGIKTSVLICFEDVFPHLARHHVDPDTDFLLNLTNNGWFGESAAQWQHAASAVFRAVENRLPLVRAANNGLSCWVDHNGAMHDIYFPGSKNIYQPGFKIAEVPLPYRQIPVNGGRSYRESATRPMTFYHRYGDCFGWGCIAASALLVGATVLSNRRSRSFLPPV
jgi:apolipoprotein N-acyltransferase